MYSTKSSESNALKWVELNDAIQMVSDEATKRTLIKYSLIREQEKVNQLQENIK